MTSRENRQERYNDSYILAHPNHMFSDHSTQKMRHIQPHTPNMKHKRPNNGSKPEAIISLLPGFRILGR
jgi:hypothetical protein